MFHLVVVCIGRTGSIYIIRNTVNDKVYIGQTTMTVHERFKNHLKPSNTKRRKSYKIYNAIEKYGRDKFFVETIESGIPIEELDEKEIEYIHMYDSFRHGYNSTPGGDGRIINKLNNEEEMLALAKRNVTAKDIADIFGVNKVTVFRTLHKLGFYYHVTPSDILELDDKHLSITEIADALGCHKDTVSRCLKKNNRRRHKEPFRTRTDIDYGALIFDYECYMPIEELCEKYRLSKSVLYRLFKIMRVRPRDEVYDEYAECEDGYEPNIFYD